MSRRDLLALGRPPDRLRERIEALAEEYDEYGSSDYRGADIADDLRAALAGDPQERGGSERTGRP